VFIQLEKLAAAEALLADVRAGKSGAAWRLLAELYDPMCKLVRRCLRAYQKVREDPAAVLNDIADALEEALRTAPPNDLDHLERMVQRRVFNCLRTKNKKLVRERVRRGLDAPQRPGQVSAVSVEDLLDPDDLLADRLAETDLHEQFAALPPLLKGVAETHYVLHWSPDDIGKVMRRSGRMVSNYLKDATDRLPLVQKHEQRVEQTRLWHQRVGMRLYRDHLSKLDSLREYLDELNCPDLHTEWLLKRERRAFSLSMRKYWPA
jgi:DNA-directed RNA polymerase specialized sigma24 family protein